ncbi:MAG TPA: NAD(P)-dependent oxidoreductase [Gemmatimonadales bacterium]|jgi:nucleoside-diphosphate-sugar epimerase
MKALVTGATGFVGSHLAEALRQRGDELTVLARSAAKAGTLAPLQCRVVSGDLHDAQALARAVEGQDVIYHVAGVIAARTEAEFIRANRDGTAQLAAAAERGGRPRLVFVSSMAAAGPARRGTPLVGNEPARPVTAYGRSKLAAEQVITGSSLPWSIVRPPMVYGPRDLEVLKVFRLARLGFAPVFGDGTQELSAIHGADLATALIAVATCPAAVGRTYYACHPEVFTSAQFVQAVGAAVGRKVKIVRIPLGVGRVALQITELSARVGHKATILTADKANEFFQVAWTGDPAPLARDTGWKAAFDLSRGLAQTFAWYRSAGWL